MNESTRERELESILHAYLQAIDAGRSPDQEELIERHPDFADDLRAFFADQNHMNRFVNSMQKVQVGDVTIDGAGAGGTDDALERIRYFGDYELLEEIARGGMGVVYKARQVSLNRIVALKMILAGQFASAAQVRRFHTEAEAAANLDHPNIVPIYEIGVHEGRHYFSMKLIVAVPMSDGTSDPRGVARLIATVARAVHFAHQRGIIHRDLKPANILMDAQGQPHVTDFGLAKRTDGESDLSQSGAILGTPAYMAPEQAAGRKGLTVAADVYSLGAILYEWLAGRPPFVGDNLMDVLGQVLEKEPVPPSRLRPGIDRDLETIVLKCLDKDPGRRYPSAEGLAEDLDRWLRGEPIEARPARALEKAWKWVRRKPALAALAATIAVATVALFISGAVFNAHLRLAGKEIDTQKAEIKRIRGEAAATLADANKRLDDAKVVQRRTAFWGDLGRAHRELKERYPLRGSEILDRHLDSDLRGWEWHYLRRQCQSELYSIQSGELCLAWSPDGAHLATVFEQNRVIVFRDAATGRIVRRLSHPEEQGMFAGVAFDKTGKRLLGFDYAKRFTLWELPSGKVIRSWNEKDTWGPAVLRPDGLQIATAVERDSDQVQLWDADTGKLIKALQIPLPYEHRNTEGITYAGAMVRALAYSPDGKRLAVGTVGGLLTVWNTDTHEKTGELAFGRFIESLAFDPANNLLYALDAGANIHLVGVDPQGKCSKLNSVYLGKVNEGKRNRTRAATLAVDPRGGRLATASVDRVLRLWKVRDNDLHLLATYSGHEQEMDAVAFSPDGRRIATLDFEWFKSRPIKIWDADNLDVPADGWPAHLTTDVLACAPDPTGRYLAVARAHRPPLRLGSSAELCDAKTGKVLWELCAHDRWTGVPSRQALAFSPDGKRLATMDAIDSPNVVRVWDVENRKKLFDLEKAGEHLTYSPDGRWLATMGRHDGVIQFWDAATGKRAFTHTCSKKYDDGNATQYGAILAFTPDSKSLVIGSGLLMEVSDDGLKEVHTFAFPERGWVGGTGCLAVSPDGRFLAASAFPGAVDLWDLEKRKLHQKVSESRLPWTHSGSFHNRWLAFTPDSKRLAYATEFGAVHLWDVEAGQDVLVLDEGQDRDYDRVLLFFSKDGHKLTALSKNKAWLNGRCRWAVWNATPLADEVLAARVASKLVDELAKSVGLKDEMRGRIEANADLKPIVRAAALKQLDEFTENTGELNDLAYAVAIKSNATAEEYRLAVRQAERAHALAPTNPHFRHTLGVAYLRVGEYVKAREAIRHAIATRPEGKRREEYYDLAFLAMIEHHLGDSGAARTLLEKLRKADSGAGPVGVAESQYRAFLAEAEALIEGKR